MEYSAIDHRSDESVVAVEARFFNSMQRYAADQPRKTVFLKAGGSLEDLIRQLAIPAREIHLILKNGRPVAGVRNNRDAAATSLQSGDVVAFSGPVPTNWCL